MLILGIESSCDDSCAALYDTQSGQLLADIVYTHTKAMRDYGGVVPELASREHVRFVPIAVGQALRAAGIIPQELDWIAVTNRPGLVGSLMVSAAYAKSLAYAADKPLAALDHIEAHLYSPLLSRHCPELPWISLVASGGHTELFEVSGVGEHRWLGGTLDDAAGEAFDKVGKLLGFSYPAGPQIDAVVSAQAKPDDAKAYHFPRAAVSGYDFSFSGLKTAVGRVVKSITEIDEQTRLHIAASAQEAIIDSLVAKIRYAQDQTGVGQIVVSGGVACNSRLRALLPDAFFPEPKHCSDNAAMVACLAGHLATAGKLTQAPLELSVEPRSSWTT